MSPMQEGTHSPIHTNIGVGELCPLQCDMCRVKDKKARGLVTPKRAKMGIHTEVNWPGGRGQVPPNSTPKDRHGRTLHCPQTNLGLIKMRRKRRIMTAASMRSVITGRRQTEGLKG